MILNKKCHSVFKNTYKLTTSLLTSQLTGLILDQEKESKIGHLKNHSEMFRQVTDITVILLIRLE